MRVLGLVLIAIPFLQYAVFDAKWFRSDGSAAGLLLAGVYWLFGLVMFSLGLHVLGFARRSAHREGAQVEREAPKTPPPYKNPPRPGSRYEGGSGRLSDVVWSSDTARVRGLLTLAREEREDAGTRIAIWASNPAVLRALQEGNAARVPILGPEPFTVVQVEKLGASLLGRRSHVVLVLAGAPPEHDAETRLLEKCLSLGCPVTIEVHHSLDDALLANAGVEKMRELFGGSIYQPIRHPLVTQAVTAARRKTAA